MRGMPTRMWGGLVLLDIGGGLCAVMRFRWQCCFVGFGFVAGEQKMAL